MKLYRKSLYDNVLDNIPSQVIIGMSIALKTMFSVPFQDPQ